MVRSYILLVLYSQYTPCLYYLLLWGAIWIKSAVCSPGKHPSLFLRRQIEGNHENQRSRSLDTTPLKLDTQDT